MDTFQTENISLKSDFIVSVLPLYYKVIIDTIVN